ncbi:hypothetical protein Nepgr_001134 [Nepenthes gracilis]|uniref:Uncharacterized protein n=1 Tax=Nepenthes gracilis TaxID=150966 RepID=A0AAD3P2D0_NEPGR|nr:hypothetical protein Nepgr_001134 [Nepenthes gracilis]
MWSMQLAILRSVGGRMRLLKWYSHLCVKKDGCGALVGILECSFIFFDVKCGLVEVGGSAVFGSGVNGRFWKAEDELVAFADLAEDGVLISSGISMQSLVCLNASICPLVE